MKKKLGMTLFAFIVIVLSILLQNKFKYKRSFYRYEQHKMALKTENYRNPTDGTIISHLPIISINTNSQIIPGATIHDKNGSKIGYIKGLNGEDVISVDINIYDNKSAQNNINNSPNLTSKALLSIRGNSSRSFSKASYEIEFIDEQNNFRELKVMGMEDGEEWALYAPFLDKTLIRNYMWMNISGSIMEYAPNVRFCECYIDGEYKGVYVMMETIEKDTSRVNIDTYKKEDRVVSYILKLDKQGEQEKNLDTFSSYSSHLDYNAGFTILYPKTELLSDDVKKAISNEFSAFEKSLYSYDFQNAEKRL